MQWARARALVAGLGAAAVLGASLGMPVAALATEPAGRTPLPTIERAAKGERCVEEPALMRRNHMEMLKHQRDDTVFGGIRGAKYSLKECIACHASSKTGSVAKTETNFCVSCHSYTAVKIDCFECHTAKPAALPARTLTPALSRKRERERERQSEMDLPGPLSTVPGGEGWGEGVTAGHTDSSPIATRLK